MPVEPLSSYLRTFSLWGLLPLLLLAVALPPSTAPEDLNRPLPLAREAQSGQVEGFKPVGQIFDNSLSIYLSPGKSLKLADPPAQITAYRITAVFRHCFNMAFRIFFSRSGHGRQFFEYNQSSREDNGFFETSSAGASRSLGTERLAAATRGEQYLEVLLEVQGRDVQVSVNGHLVKTRLKTSRGQFDFAIEPRAQANRVLIDRVQVQDLSPRGGPRILAENDFTTTIQLADLPRSLGLLPQGRLSRLVGCAVLGLGALLWDLLLLWGCSAARLGSWGRLTPAGVLFLLLPLQASLLMALRAALRLPYTAALLCLAALVIFKGAALVASRPMRPAPRPLIPLLLGLAGLALHGVALVFLRQKGVEHLAEVNTFTYLLAGAPMAAFALLWLLSHDPPLEGVLLAAAQYGTAYLHPPAPDDNVHCLFLSAAMIPYLALALVHLLRSPRACTTRIGLDSSGTRPIGVLLRGVSGLVMVVAVLGYVEVGLRAVPTLDQSFRVQRQFHLADWSVAQHTAILGHKGGQASLEIRGRRHPLSKPAGSFRVACLGSSSTAGSGANSEEMSYPRQLQQILEAAADQPVEVINGGIPGVPLYLLKVYLEEVLVLLKPDLVVLYFGANKDRDEARVFHQKMQQELQEAPFIRTEEELWAAFQLRYNPRWLMDLFLEATNLRTFVALMKAVKGISGSSGPPPAATYNTATPQEIVKLCAEQRIPVLLIPEVFRCEVLDRGRAYLGTSANQYHPIFRGLAQENAARGVGFASLLPYYDPKKIYSYFLDDVHMNDAGYRYLAQSVADVLFSRGYLKRRAAATQPTSGGGQEPTGSGRGEPTRAPPGAPPAQGPPGARASGPAAGQR